MDMKKVCLPFLAIMLFYSCTTNTSGFTINGTLRGTVEDSTMVFLKKLDDNNQPVEVDTAFTKNGSFVFTGTAGSPEVHYLFVDKNRGYTAMILENGKIDYAAQIDSLGYATIKGTPQNDIFADYLESSRELSQQARDIQMDMQEAQLSAEVGKEARIAALRDEMAELEEEYKSFEIDYIKNNPNGLISALLLDKAIATQALPISEIEGLYNALSEDIKNTSTGKKTMESLTKMKGMVDAEKNTAVGAKAPEFSGPNPEGETIALNDVMGKVTLIDFWAAWCRPCRAENPNIVAVYNKYHDKGFNVLGVSLDRTADAWKKAIADDGLVWNHISNIAYFDDQIARLYNVNAIPAAFLLDENGVIVAKNLRGAELEREVAKLLD
jgi:peroxiredoxin